MGNMKVNLIKSKGTDAKSGKKHKLWVAADIELFCFASLGVLFLAVFHFAPMFGLMLAFKDGNNSLTAWEALIDTDWVGLKNFKMFLTDPMFKNVFINTLGLNLIMLLVDFPAPIIFALILNEVRHARYKRTIQTIANFPHFVSWIVFGGMIIALTDMTFGIVNPLLEFFGLSSEENPVNLAGPEYFWATIIISSLIKGVGWGSIVYLAAIAGISPDYYEAATLDGANRLQKIIHITLPNMSNTIVVFLLLNISGILGNNFEQFYTLQNAVNLDKSEVIATYSYKKGISQQKYSYTAAMGFFNSVISLVLLATCNFLSKKFVGRGLY